MMELIFWRHAEAEEGANDLARALTAKGEKQAKRMAGFLNARLPASARILVSPAVRTQQTASALGRAFETVDAIAPGAEADAVLKAAGWPWAEGNFSWTEPTAWACLALRRAGLDGFFDAGSIEPGDEIITTPWTMAATATSRCTTSSSRGSAAGSAKTCSRRRPS